MSCTTRQQAGPIDLRGIADRANLRAIVEADRGAPGRSGRYLCPFHPDHDPDLTVDPRANRWRCWACGANGDAIDWLVRREDLTVIEAARRLDGYAVNPPAPARSPRPEPRRVEPELPAWHNTEWQEAVDRIVRRAQETLWSRAGREALAWLRWRGLDDHTIRRFALGFVPRAYRTTPLEILRDQETGKPRAIYAARGITFPAIHTDSWYHADPDPIGPRWVGCNVRRLSDPDVFEPLARGGKCLAMLGTERGHLYPFPSVETTQGDLPALVVEGEVDSLIGVQEVGHLVHVGTVGGATTRPHQSALDALERSPLWLIGSDHDAAGAAAAWRWKEINPDKARRALLPTGKDLGEFHQAGESVLGWLRGELDRLGWAEPSMATR